jgi:hypothetical protein
MYKNGLLTGMQEIIMLAVLRIIQRDLTMVLLAFSEVVHGDIKKVIMF